MPEFSRKMIAEHELEFPLVHDERLILSNALRLTFEFPEDLARVYSDFGIKLPEINETENWTLPMPARYLVDNEGLIRDAAVNPDYTRRPEPRDMLELLEMLG